MAKGTEPPDAKAPRRRLRRWLLRGLLGGAALLVAFAAWQALTWPDVEELATANPTTTAFIEHFRAREARAGRAAAVELRWIAYERTADNLKRAVLCAEDIGFFDHDGFAVDEMKAALRQAWERRTFPRGASTITQQLAKNLWLSPSRNPWRKVKEALLTRQLEAHLEKRRILEIYLNVVELGPGVYGVEAASRRYFGKSASALTERESAQLAAALPKPSQWHPGAPGAAYARRVETVLARMRQAGWLRKVI